MAIDRTGFLPVAASFAGPGSRTRSWPSNNSLRAGLFICQYPPMPKRKSLTPAEQAEKFRLATQKRADAGMPTIADADAAMDAKIAQNIRDYGA